MTSTPSPLGALPSSLPSSPSSGAQNEKSRRYDRQLRLWGDHGQQALERGRVALIGGANAMGCEVLKCLVLPGIGAFTIVDHKRATRDDVESNFFMDKDAVGQSRGGVAKRLLCEMNGEVSGDFVDETVEEILKTRPDFLTTFTLVVATELKEDTLKKVSEILWEAGIPLVVVRSCGFVAYIRTQIKEHTIIESHPDNTFVDFRLDCPFPELTEFMATQDMSAMTKQQHSHTPYLVILFKVLEQWRREHEGKAPANYKEKKQFKQMVLDAKLKNSDGVPEDEENFDEAASAVNTALCATSIPSSVRAILDDPHCKDITPKSTVFWIMARALKDFVEEDGRGLLPVSGKLPDMFSDSERYIQLQNVYREQAARDAENVLRRVHYLLESVGRPVESVRESTVKLFCKESANLRLIRCGGSISSEHSGSSPDAPSVNTHFEQDPDSSAMYYFILRGADRFETESNARPGELDVETDVGKLKNCVAKVLADYGLSACPAKDDLVHEVCRYGGAELHAVASAVGAAAAHECVKLITSQYVPVSNLFVYNAMKSETISLKV